MELKIGVDNYLSLTANQNSTKQHEACAMECGSVTQVLAERQRFLFEVTGGAYSLCCH